MEFMIKDKISHTVGKLAARMGYVKMPEGVAATRGSIFGYSSLGSLKKQCEAYQGHVYKCVTLIYRRAISVPMKLYKERAEDAEEIKRHSFIDLLRRPNPYMTGADLKAVTFMHRDLAGMAFWYVVKNRLGRPAEIWPLPVANFVKFNFAKDGNALLNYEFRTDSGRPVTYLPEEIVYFRYPHPLYILDGASPIQAMAYSYDTDLAIRVYQRNFFQNSARPDIVFETDQEIRTEDARRLLLSWKQAHQGVSKAWEPAILDKGLKIKSLSTAAKDFEFAVLAGWTKEDILEAYNIPEGKLGTVKDVNRANAIGIDITFNSECISPRLDSYEDQITRDLLPLYDSGLFCEHVSCIPRDLEHDLKERESNLKSYFTTVNEERAKEGMDPVPWGDAPFVPINLIQYGETAEIEQRDALFLRQTAGVPPDPLSPAPPPHDSPSSHTASGTVASGTVGPTVNISAKDARLRIGHERRVAARSKAFQAFLRKFFKGQKKEVLENLEKHFSRIDGAISGMSFAKAKDWLCVHKADVEAISINLRLADKTLSEAAVIYLEAALLAGGEEALAFVDAGIAFDLFSPQAARFIREAIIAIKDVNLTTHNQIVMELSEGFEAGESIKDLAKRIEKVFYQADKTRSLRIAQTEINKGVNFGALEGYRQSGVVDKKGWLAGGGARKSHVHAAARYTAENAIPLSQDFEVGGGRGPAPGSIGIAAEDINCRCTIFPVVKEN